jgi:hypothetical protein
MSRRPVVGAVLMVIVVAGCSGGPQQRPKAPPTSAVEVVRSGFSARGKTLGVAALIRVSGSRPLRDIRLSVNLIAGRNNFASDGPTIPYCPPKRDCWWGKSYRSDKTFGSDHLIKPARSVTKVAVTVAAIASYGASPAIRELTATPRNGKTEIRAPRRKGVVYVIALKGALPRFGWSTTVRATTTRLSAPGPMEGERERAFFYAR